MKKRCIQILGLLVCAVAVASFHYLLGARGHEAVDSPWTFRIAPFDERSKAFVLEREAKWFSLKGDDFILSDIIRLAGQAPSVRTLTNLLTSATLEYARWKRAASTLATAKEGYFELATLHNTNANPTLWVSDDGHLGLLWTDTNALIVFQDVVKGLQETQYRKRR